MDTKALIKSAKARFKHQEAKIYLQEKYHPRLALANQGGMWNITPELMGFLRTSNDDKLIILDSFNKPIQVDRKILLDAVVKTYTEVMADWHSEYSELQKNR